MARRLDDTRKLLALAGDLITSGDYAGAVTALRKAKDLAVASGNLTLAAEIIRREFRACWEASDIAGAEHALEEEVAVNRRLGDTYRLADSLVGLAFFPGISIDRKPLLAEARGLAAKHGYKDIQQQIEFRLTAFKMAGLDLDGLS